MEVLYDRLAEVEELAKHYIIYKGLNQINVPETQRKIFEEYESNPVLHDALLGRQTVADSLEELAQVNKGARRFLPHRRNNAHNNRVARMGELVPDVGTLMTRGILYPDNAIFATLGAAAIALGTAFVLSKLSGTNGNEITQRWNIAYPSIMFPILAVFGSATRNRSKHLPRNEARYLDDKVSQFYGTLLN